jgi:hypothetical protein
MCAICHQDNYDSYMKHGHPLKLYHTAGQQPPADLYPWGQTLPALPNNVQWADIEYIMRGSSGAGSFRFYGGNRGTRKFDGHQIDLVSGNATSATSGYSCGKCHTAGFTDYPKINNQPDPDPTHHQSGLPWIQGIWALEGIQCEACHGAGGRTVR